MATRKTSARKTLRAKTTAKTSARPAAKKTSGGKASGRGAGKARSTAKQTSPKKTSSKTTSGKGKPTKTQAKKATTKKTTPKTSGGKSRAAGSGGSKAAPKTPATSKRPAASGKPSTPGTARKATARKTSAKAGAAASTKPRKKPSKAQLTRVLEQCDKMLGAVSMPECRSVLERAVYLVLREQGTDNTTSKAMAVLREEFVDWNEVRISRSSELSRLMSGSSKGPAIRRFHERADRMRELIDQVYNDKNEPSLEFLMEERTKGRFEYLEDVDDLGLHNAYALVQWLSGEDKLVLVSKELAIAAYALGLTESDAVTKVKAELSELADGLGMLVALQAHLNQLGGMEQTQWPPSIRELAV